VAEELLDYILVAIQFTIRIQGSPALSSLGPFSPLKSPHALNIRSSAQRTLAKLGQTIDTGRVERGEGIFIRVWLAKSPVH